MTSKQFNYCPECGSPLTSDLRCTNCNYDAVKDLPRDIEEDRFKYIPPEVINDNYSPGNERAEKNVAELKIAATALTELVRSSPEKIAKNMIDRESPLIGIFYILCLIILVPLALSTIASSTINELTSGYISLNILVEMIIYVTIAVGAFMVSMLGLAKVTGSGFNFTQTINSASTTLIPLVVCSVLSILLTVISPFPALIIMLSSIPMACASIYSYVTLITNQKNKYWIYASILFLQVIIGVIAYTIIIKSALGNIADSLVMSNLF